LETYSRTPHFEYIISGHNSERISSSCDKKKHTISYAKGLCDRGHSDLNLMMHSKIPIWWSRFHFYKPEVISWSRNTPFMEI